MMKYKMEGHQVKKVRGFTLIELLVVIAIISLLSSIVLASLTTARNKAKDAAIVEEMVSLRTEAELDYKISDGTYKACICTANSPGGFLQLRLSIQQKTPTYESNVSCAQNIALGSRPTAWGAAVKLNNNDNVFCVDSTGHAGLSSVAPPLSTREITSGGALPTDDVVCDDQ